MRLSQLARKLGVTHSDIIKFVEGLDATASLTAHSKIEDGLIEKIKNQFDPDGEKFHKPDPTESDIEEVNETKDTTISKGESENEIAALPIVDKNLNEAVESTLPTAESEPVIEETVSHNPIAKSEVIDEAQQAETADTTLSESTEAAISEVTHTEEGMEIETELQTENEPDSEEITDGDHHESEFIDTERYAEDESAVIRAKLVKLEGIKVVGKIDLPPPPQPKVKEEKDTNTESSEGNTKSYRGRKSRKNHRNRKPESLKEKQEREKRKQERERKAQEKKIKAKKKQHYIEKLEKGQGNKPTSSKRTKSQKRKATENRKPMIQKSKNPVKRFWHWLNGKYD